MWQGPGGHGEIDDELAYELQRTAKSGGAYYATTSPGMPKPGPNFLAKAKSLVEPDEKDVSPYVEDQYRQALYADDRNPYHLTLEIRGKPVYAVFVNGHIWKEPRVPGTQYFGPQPADVMIIGKLPGHDEARAQKNLVGPSGTCLHKAMNDVGINPDDFYVTNLVKFPNPDAKSGALPAGWIKEEGFH